MLTILAGLALVLPGICWAVWLEKNNPDPLDTLAKMVGVSISANVLLALLFFLLGIPINSWVLLGEAAFWVTLIVWGIFRRKPKKMSWLWLPALAGFGAVIAWRLVQASDLIVPAWVDSLHHVLIVRKMIENGGLMANMQPYLDVPFYYHYAFHSLTAQFAALSGLAPAQAVLILGQVLNAAIGLSLYALGKALFKDWRPALMAALLVTFATKMPAYYLSWGRYTLTVGMILLPLSTASALKLLDRGWNKRDGILMALLTAGTLLAHYFTGLLLALFLIIQAIVWLKRIRPKKIPEWKPIFCLGLASLVGFGLVFPWLYRVFRFSRMGLGFSVSGTAGLEGIFNNTDQWQYLWYLLGENSAIILLAGALIGLGLMFKKSEQRAFGIWAVLIMVLALPIGLSFGSFRYDHFAIVLFLPMALLFSLYISEAARFLDKLTHQKWPGWVLVGSIGLGAIIWGGIETQDIINPRTEFTTQADLDAIAWIDEHLPQDARFFINTTSWGYGVSRGIDGGAWILPLTGHWTLAPTLFYTFAIDTKMIEQNMDWSIRARTVTGCTAELWNLVEDATLSHIYLRSGVGRLTESNLAACSGLDEIYDRDGVTIFAIKP